MSDILFYKTAIFRIDKQQMPHKKKENIKKKCMKRKEQLSKQKNIERRELFNKEISKGN